MSEFIEGLAIGGLIGAFLGANVGILWAGLCNASKTEENENDKRTI